MNVWYHLPTIFSRRSALRIAGLTLIVVAFITMLFFPNVSHAETGTSKTINFQGRLLTAAGSVVPDGFYNIQFKIYQDGSGNAAGNPDGTLKWTETYVNNGGTSGVEIKNGFLSVSLGSVNPFGTSVDWNQDTIWLSMNIAGSSASCTTFGTAPCAADGEMLPMKKMAASPFAINSGMVGGKNANELVQLGQGTQTDASNNSSISINKTGTGKLIQLQNTATDVFTVSNAGDIQFGANANHTIGIGAAAADTPGLQLTVTAGTGGTGTGSTGGTLVLAGGDGGGTNGNGGDVVIDAGGFTGSGADGTISLGETHASNISVGSTSNALNQTIAIGANNTSGSVSNVTIGAGGSATSGSTTVQAKDDVTIGTNGSTRATFIGGSNKVVFGNGTSSSAPSDFVIQGTDSSATATTGGSLTIQGGNATTGNANGGDVTLAGGTASGTGTTGLVVLGTPTFSTVLNDTNCYTSGALVASSCTISGSSVNSSSAVLVGFSTTGQTATLPDPTNTTAGRVLYIMAVSDTESFSLSFNAAANQLDLRAGTTATMLWNGSDWTVAGTSSASAVQDMYSTDSASLNVQIGSGTDDGTVTLLTVDKAASAPGISDASLLGSMYYDTTLGELQCYEADGWGSCSASPDNFITISPQYTNAVMNGAGIGTMDSDLCSDDLNINDGSASQPTICGTNETYNFYRWTSAETSAQTKSIYVTYQLPSSFKEFVAGSTSLMGRTDGTDADVSYQIYRNDGSGLTACGSSVAVSTGAQTTWQQAAATLTDDPSNCSFAAGDSIVFKIDLTSANDANAYVSNLGFTFSNH